MKDYMFNLSLQELFNNLTEMTHKIFIHKLLKQTQFTFRFLSLKETLLALISYRPEMANHRVHKQNLAKK